MPVRIYDIAKKLGIESKEVLAKAKELGITNAKVPSSSLDKITAAYLEEKLGGVPAHVPEPPPQLSPPEPVVLLRAPEEEAPPPPVPEPEPIPDLESSAGSTAPADHADAPISEEPAAETEAPPVTPPLEATPREPSPAPESEQPSQPPAPVEPAEPPTPARPGIGDLVGKISLPPRPHARGVPAKPAPKTPTPAARSAPGGRPVKADGKAVVPSASAPTKFVAPATGEVITLKPPIVVRDLAERLGRKPFQIIADLMELGVFANVNQAIEELVAQRVCAKYNFRFEVEKRERGGGIVHAPKRSAEPEDEQDDPTQLLPRAPVVTIMGHVDHGKTTLLDLIRKTNVAAREAGGITQHIGAYTIAIPHPERKNDLQQITFLDTPGHAAFSSMRARGANVTDIVVLVVAANDGVMPQTLEALSHAQAARVPIVVAVNKIDHPGANPLKVRQQLQDKDLVCEEWGGNTIFVDCSAVSGQGIDKLLEMLVLQADVLELKANPNRAAVGNVIESGMEPGGPIATVLVRKGTLNLGDTVLCGPYCGKVRALINEEGKRLKEAGPSVAVKVLGLDGVPEAGLEFKVITSDKDARAVAEERALLARTAEKEARPVTLEELFQQLEAGHAKILRLVVKADTQGSVEAIVEALKKVDTEKVSLEIIHSAVGTITKEDVMLASASKGLILGFHTRIDSGVSELAKREGVQIKLYSIIYELIDEVVAAMAGLLDPLLKEVVLGAAEVRKIFPLSKGGNVAGCVIASGRVTRGKIRVVRRKTLLFDGLTASLRRFQDEVNEVRAGMECGIRVDGFNDFQIGDSLECYTIEKVPQKL